MEFTWEEMAKGVVAVIQRSAFLAKAVAREVLLMIASGVAFKNPEHQKKVDLWEKGIVARHIKEVLGETRGDNSRFDAIVETIGGISNVCENTKQMVVKQGETILELQDGYRKMPNCIRELSNEEIKKINLVDMIRQEVSRQITTIQPATSDKISVDKYCTLRKKMWSDEGLTYSQEDAEKAYERYGSEKNWLEVTLHLLENIKNAKSSKNEITEKVIPITSSKPVSKEKSKKPSTVSKEISDEEMISPD